MQADYVVVGAGAMGLAFADVAADAGASLVIVDRHARPGGHWNDAYDFVRLHQPSAYYGVHSLPLGDSFEHRATGAEVRAYYERVLERLLATGRVRYFPSSDWRGDRFVELGSGDERLVVARRAVVDATRSQTDVPSTRPPPFAVAPGVRCVPVNDLASLAGADATRWVVLGAGKTATDACLQLLDRGVPAHAIRWVRPREPWIVDRANMLNGDGLVANVASLATQLEIAARAETVREVFERLDAAGQLLRLDDQVVPTMYRCAIASRVELARLRTIQNVVRLGHVQRIDRDRIVLDRGDAPTDGTTIHVDCTARGIQKLAPVPVFGSGTITLQAITTCQPTFSAALIARIETTLGDLAQKNALAAPIPYPDVAVDWLRMLLASLAGAHARSMVEPLRTWSESTRLNVIGGLRRAVETDPAMKEPFDRFRAALKPAVPNLMRLVAQGST